MCGEKQPLWLPVSSGLGSPPRVRGKGKKAVLVVFVLGITPACAGKRIAERVLNREGKDHPRVCGEKLKS